ncbi:aldolase [Ascobolus immersus RN42]|uniref:hydroxymethylglutaryl-CoA lyase n=1 Tax=Ascobolus immersus RN42 TaxID=1160509 RepID=A0A3N4J0B1_ASCIM|nr:aldolase [Ascobolus immersus RN42]
MPPRLAHLRTARNLGRSFTTASTPRPRVRITEVGPRDGLQNEPRPIPLDTKLELLSRLSRTGLKHIEAGSFVSPKWVPQMADSANIARTLPTRAEIASTPAGEKIRWSYLCPNMKGMESALEYKVPEIAVFLSASEGFSKKNLNCSINESFEKVIPVVKAAKAAGIPVRGYVSMVITCPYSGKTPPQMVLKVTEKLLEMGCYEVSLGDTVGMGTVDTVGTLLKCLKEEGGIRLEDYISGHFHDTFGMGIANVGEAVKWGVRGFDGSVAGLGGCPYAKGATGNVATEDLVWFLEGAGFDTGVNLEELAKIGDWISADIGRRNESRVGKAIMSKVEKTAAKGEQEALKTINEIPRAIPVAA